MTGEIVRLNERGFGFIRGLVRDVFFHATGMENGYLFGELQVGDVVTFDMREDPKGERAVNVKPRQGGPTP
jgi:cold shock CspA family protein